MGQVSTRWAALPRALAVWLHGFGKSAIPAVASGGDRRRVLGIFQVPVKGPQAQKKQPTKPIMGAGVVACVVLLVMACAVVVADHATSPPAASSSARLASAVAL